MTTVFLYTKETLDKIAATADERFDAVELPMKLRDATYYRVYFGRSKRLSPKNAVACARRAMLECIDVEFLSLFSNERLVDFFRDCDPAELVDTKKYVFLGPVSVILDYEIVQDDTKRVMRLVTKPLDQWVEKFTE